MLTDAAGRERAVGDEGTARALVGIQGSVWGRVVGFSSAVGGLGAGLAGMIIMTVSNPFYGIGIKANDSVTPNRHVNLSI